MAFNPMDIPPGGGPSLEGRPGKPWYRNLLLWVVVVLVVSGALYFAH